MGRRRIKVVAAGSGLLLLAVGACSTGGGAEPGGAALGNASSGGPVPVIPVNGDVVVPANIAIAQGDVCRGEPVPLAQHFVPPGWCARRIASGVDSLRQLTFAPNGDLLGTTTAGRIVLFRDANADGAFTNEEIHDWASTGGNGNNAHLDVAGGFVYAGSDDGVKRFAYTAGALVGGAPEDVVVGQPTGGHKYHTTRVYDGWLYVHSGSSSNATHESGAGAADYDTKRSLIKRFDLSKLVPGAPFQWDAGEPFTLGLRNVNGFARNETTKKIYGVVNGLDSQTYKGVDVHDDNPGEQVVEIAAGKKYGYPFCFTAQRVLAEGSSGPVLVPGTQLINVNFPGNPHDDAWCAANSLPPTTFIQAHSAPLDIAFFDRQAKGALPEELRGGAFIALHGSWDRGNPTGHKVIWQPFNADGSSPVPTSDETTTTFKYQVIFGGGTAEAAVDGPWSASTTSTTSVRPAGLAISPIDGALYVSSDNEGALYRVGLSLK